jgi:hypothetical protein
MHDILMILLKISLVIFMAGNLLDMGLRLNPQEALRGRCEVHLGESKVDLGFLCKPKFID